MVTVADLKDQTLTADNAILYCPFCGVEFSANAGDYWSLPKTHKFLCPCGEAMKLVTKHTVYRRVK